MMFFPRNHLALSAALAIALVGASPSGAQTRASNQNSPPGTRGAGAANPVPTPVAQVILIRDALTAFNHANMTGNYSVLRALGSPNFRSANSVERLTQLFAPFRTNSVNLSPTLYLNPALSRQPVIENGRLRLVGSFPSQPMAVNFDLVFEPFEQQWKLFGVAVSLAPAAQSAAPRQ